VPSLLIGSERISSLKYRPGNQSTFWHLIPTNAGISCSWAPVSFSRETSLCIVKVTCVNLRLHPLRYGNDLSEESWLLHKTEKSRSHKLGLDWTSDCAKTKTSHTRFNSLRLRSDTMMAHDVNCRRLRGGGFAVHFCSCDWDVFKCLSRDPAILVGVFRRMWQRVAWQHDTDVSEEPAFKKYPRVVLRSPL
jgi:hypothetical protein